MKHVSVLSGALALGLGLFAATGSIAQACEVASGNAAAGGGGSASALQRAGLCPAGAVDPGVGWSRMPAAAVTQVTAAASPFDARAQRGGVHTPPVRVAAGN